MWNCGGPEESVKIHRRYRQSGVDLIVFDLGLEKEQRLECIIAADKQKGSDPFFRLIDVDCLKPEGTGHKGNLRSKIIPSGYRKHTLDCSGATISFRLLVRLIVQQQVKHRQLHNHCAEMQAKLLLWI